MGLETDDSTLSWINKDFLQNILSTKNTAILSVTKFNITKAVGKGENYASLLLRVSLEYEANGIGNNKMSIIIKSLPAGDMLQTFLIESEVFPKENRLYLEAMPAMHAIVRRKLPQDEELTFGPAAFPCERPNTLVLEDLRERNFRMASRHNGLDLKHSLLVLRKLAKYHAASVALLKEDPSKVEGYEETLYTENKLEMLDKFIPCSYNSLASIVEEWEGFEKYGNKLRDFGKICSGFVIKTMKPSDTFLNVLNHGDCWVNNCMFKYNEVTGELEDMIFVDLQMTRYASPVLDLLYFMYTSVAREVRMTSYQQLLAEYHSVINEALEALDCEDKAFSMEELEEDLRLREGYGLVAACSVLCAVMADPDDAMELDLLTEEDLNNGKTGFMDKAMRGSRYREELQLLLPLFESKGLLQ